MVHSPSSRESSIFAESRGDWVFSLVAPSQDSSKEDGDVDNPRVLVRLESSGGIKSDVESPVLSSSDRFLERSSSKEKESAHPSSRETALLLDQSDVSDSNNRSGWNFQGPNWSIGSSVLLKVTHRPAWEGLPEYTQMSWARDCCRRSCCRSKSRPVRHTTDIYSTPDIVRVEQDLMIGIRGVGPCHAVRLFLKKRSFAVDPAPTLQLREKLEQQWNLGDNSAKFNRFSEEADFVPLPPEDRPDKDGGPIITFAMPMDHDDFGPPLLWKVELPSNKHIAIDSFTVLDGRLNPNQEDTHQPSHVYINGYQSWSFAGSVAKGQPQPTSAMPDVFSHAFNNGGKRAPAGDTMEVFAEDEDQLWDEQGYDERQPSARKQKHSGYQSEFFTCITSDAASAYRESPRLLDEWGGPALVLGWLSQHYQLGVITVDKNLGKVAMDASAEGQIWKRGGCTDWAYAQLVAPHSYDEEPMVHYLHAVAAHNEAKPLQNGSLLTGWCSWYHYYEKISAANLRENFKTLHALRNKLPTNVAVVDDGYMTAWGDWDSLKPKAFPGSEDLAVVSKDIRDNGMRPGLWIAPFACDRFSQLAKDHPEWIIRNDEGRYANSSNCGKFFYGLDATNPDVREFVFRCVKRAVEEWGFDVLKIDFLYSACLAGNGKYDLSVSRAEAMHMALQTIRAAAGPGTFLIGCGCPIGTGVGYVDGMRVSADTGPTWYPAFPFPWWDHGTLPALRSMIRNSISRACMGHRWWHNDPDCLLFGKSTSLTDDEVASAASVVAMTCGMLLLSDDLTKLSRGRLHILTKIYPMTGATAVVLDLHSSSNGMPCLLRLWCTDHYNLAPLAINTPNSPGNNDTTKDHNAEATFFGRYASFSSDDRMPKPNERKRNCIHVARGLGTWTLLSLSNWLDKPAVVYAPSQALHTPPGTGWEANAESEQETGSNKSQKTSKYGYHMFGFWTSSYIWMPDESQEPDVQKRTLSKLLDPHATEIFHIKPVSLNMPQYIGSDIHFSCGYEVRSFQSSVSSVTVYLKNDWHRVGSVFLYVPRLDMDVAGVKVNGVAVTRKPGGWDVVANTPRHNGKNGHTCLGRIIQIWVTVHADQSEHDGEICVQF